MFESGSLSSHGPGAAVAPSCADGAAETTVQPVEEEVAGTEPGRRRSSTASSQET